MQPYESRTPTLSSEPPSSSSSSSSSTAALEPADEHRPTPSETAAAPPNTLPRDGTRWSRSRSTPAWPRGPARTGERTPAVLRADAAPAALSPGVVRLFAIAGGLSVANVYFAQPLLDTIAADFSVSHAVIGLVISATQAGYAAGLLLLVPLGDLLDRRRLIAGHMLLSVFALLAVALAPTMPALLASLAVVGLLAVVVQTLVAFAATLAAPAERGRVVGTVTSGVVLGILLARVMAGLLADAAGWRAVYLVSAGATLVMAATLVRVLPRGSAGLSAPAMPAPSAEPATSAQRAHHAPPVRSAARDDDDADDDRTGRHRSSRTAAPAPADANGRPSYAQLLRSVFVLFLEERVLRIRAGLALFIFAAFSVFWTTLVLPLSGPPHALSHTAIGLFGLVGVAGALAAGRTGQLVDRGFARATTGVGLGLLLVSWLPLAFTPRALWATVLGVVLLDLAVQAVHVTNQSLLFARRPEARSRLVAGYMLCYSIGSGLGSIASTLVYARAGWTGVCLLGAGISALALAFWLATLREPRAARLDTPVPAPAAR